MNRFNLGPDIIKTPFEAVFWEADWQRYRQSRMLIDNCCERIFFVALRMTWVYGLIRQEQDDLIRQLERWLETKT
jgi:hypothetical protein